ncbi:unnamed protein product [Amoebophrya sp. A25]|nr:unnamed protein product [Amoebophrya sp. A25]|eukprot:GSA25T00017609001.1
MQVRTEAPYAGIWTGCAGKETGANSPADTTERPMGFATQLLAQKEYSDRVGKATGSRYEVVPTGYSTPYQQTAPYSVRDPLYDSTVAHLEYREKTRHFQQKKPTANQMTKTPISDNTFYRARSFVALEYRNTAGFGDFQPRSNPPAPPPGGLAGTSSGIPESGSQVGASGTNNAVASSSGIRALPAAGPQKDFPFLNSAVASGNPANNFLPYMSNAALQNLGLSQKIGAGSTGASTGGLGGGGMDGGMK